MTDKVLASPGRAMFTFAMVLALALVVLSALAISGDDLTPQTLHGSNLLVFWLFLVSAFFVLFYLLAGYVAAVVNAIYGKVRTEPGLNIFYLPGGRLRELVGTFAITLLVVQIFAMAFRALSLLEGDAAFCVNGHPAALGYFDAAYFSTVTMATVGYGDIVPASRWAKSGVMLEILAALANVTLVLSALASVLKDRAPKAAD